MLYKLYDIMALAKNVRIIITTLPILGLRGIEPVWYFKTSHCEEADACLHP